MLVKIRSNNKRKRMQIFVKTMTGRSFTVNVNENDPVDEVKKKIYEITGLDPTQQKLLFGGETLEDKNTLKDYGIIKESTVFVVSILAGGSY